MAKAAFVTVGLSTEVGFERLTHSVLGFVVLGLTHARQVLYRQHGKSGLSLRKTGSFLALSELNSGARVCACSQSQNFH